MSRKPEQVVWDFLKSLMDPVPGFMMDRVENELNRSMPDVTFSYRGHHGWIELKAIDNPETLPKKYCGVFKLDKFTTGQRLWLRNRGHIGGCCWLLIKTKNTEDPRMPGYLVLLSHQQVDWVGVESWDFIISHATAVFVGAVVADSFAEILIGREV